MNEYTRTAACSLQPHTARIHWLSIRVSCLQDAKTLVLWGFAFRFVLNEIFQSVHVQWWRVQPSVPSCQFIYIHCVLWTEVPKQDTMAGECNYFILLRTFVKSNECCQRPLRGWGACWAAPRGPARCNGSLIAPAPNTVPGSPMTKFAQK